MNRAYITTEIKKWNDIFQLDQNFLKNFVFRGQNNSNWRLTTSLSRMIDRHHPGYHDKALPLFYETQMINDFKWKYPSYEKGRIPKEEESIEWLSLMQHYGSPTRMLDFSYSIYVALFMALDGSSSEKSAIWAINKSIIKNRLEKK